MINYKSIIKRNPNKRFGKPCVRDTRITVYDVLGWLATGMTFNETISDFPELTMDDIKACLAYAADREHKLQYLKNEKSTSNIVDCIIWNDYFSSCSSWFSL